MDRTWFCRSAADAAASAPEVAAGAGWFDTTGFMPHGHCYLWKPELLLLHVGSDLLIAAAYFTIPALLIFFARRRPDVPFRPLLGLFGAFIVACGLTHVFGVIDVWHSTYWYSGALKFVTAGISAYTAWRLAGILPEAFRLRSPAELEQANRRLQAVEQELRETNASLESRVAERTRAAAQASRAKSEFLANMSHEIRTPMTAILGYTDILIERGDIGDAPAERLEALATIQRNGQHLLQLINDILDLSKIEARRVDLEVVDFSPVALVGDVCTLMETRARAKGLPLEVHWEGPLPELAMGDPMRIRQVLINLLSNAVKFTEVGRVDVEVGIRTEPATTLHFIVRDTGIGMTEEQVAAIFEPFAQAAASTSRVYGGTGLGLTISGRLLDLLGGHLDVDSAPGRGTRFEIEIPVGVPPDVRWNERPAEVLRGPEPAAAAGDEGARLSGRVLLAEDGPDNQRLIGHFLRRAGLDVEIVGNGQLAATRALEEAELDRGFDAIVMDVQMPVMDGIAATRYLRSQGLQTPIIALTAYAMESDRERCLEAGYDAFETKPVDRARLLAVLGEVLGKPGSTD